MGRATDRQLDAAARGKGIGVIRIIFRRLDGAAEAIVETAPGQSLMNAAKTAGIEGIEAICGGSMACGTCHVYVDEAWFSRLPPVGAAEQEVVAFGAEPRPTSRLSCQIQITPGMNGLIVTVPTSQI